MNLSDHSVKCWGTDSDANLFSNATTPVSINVAGSVTGISAGLNYTTFLIGGKQYGFGTNSNGSGQLDGASLTTPGTLTGISQISAGNFHTCALASGKVYCWGDYNQGELGESNNHTAVSGIGPASFVSAGGQFTCALVDGEVYCWGRNDLGQVNGTPGPWPQPGAPGSHVPNLSGVNKIASGMIHNCALVSGEVYCWGGSDSGVLGGSSTTTPIVGLSGVTQIASHGSAYFTCALAAGRVYCWGNNSAGQLGGSSATVPVPGVKNVTAIAVGAEHACAIANNGASVYCWGKFGAGQTGNLTSSSVKKLTFQTKENEGNCDK